jgi:glycogen synthase
MRILMTTDTIGGVFTYSVDLTAELSGRGAEVTLVTFGRAPTDEQRDLLRRAGAAGIVETDLALEWMEDPWSDLASSEELLLELERDLRADVVHLNAYAHGGAPFRAPVVVVAHSCVYSWWAAVHGTEAPAEWERYRTLVHRGLAGATSVVAPSHIMLAGLERWYGPLRVPYRVILNGSAEPELAVTRVPRRPIVLGAGRMWDEAKNAAALRRVARRPGLRGRVLLAGDIGRPTANDPDEGARLLGMLAAEELAAIRREVAVFAAPALYEPFGLAILEAARDGCALVLADIPSLRELWDGAATFVDPRDDAALGDALETLLANPALTAAQAEHARCRARVHSMTAMADAYLDTYRGMSGACEPVAA